MKRILTLLFTLILIPFSTFAISRSDLQNNPERYVKVAEGQTDACYVDSYSIKSLRYAPPYYTIRAKVYGPDYAKNGIFEFTITCFYDYNRNSKQLMENIVAESPNKSDTNSMAKKFMSQLNKNIGIKYTMTDINCYTLDGTYVNSLRPFYNQSVVLNSNPYHAANYMFYKCYNIYFHLKFESENLY